MPGTMSARNEELDWEIAASAAEQAAANEFARAVKQQEANKEAARKEYYQRQLFTIKRDAILMVDKMLSHGALPPAILNFAPRPMTEEELAEQKAARTKKQVMRSLGRQVVKGKPTPMPTTVDVPPVLGWIVTAKHEYPVLEPKSPTGQRKRVHGFTHTVQTGIALDYYGNLYTYEAQPRPLKQDDWLTSGSFNVVPAEDLDLAQPPEPQDELVAGPPELSTKLVQMAAREIAS